MGIKAMWIKAPIESENVVVSFNKKFFCISPLYTPQGKITSNWYYKGNTVCYEFQIP